MKRKEKLSIDELIRIIDEEIAELLKTALEPLKSVLVLRQQLAKSFVKKYLAMANTVCADSRVRECFLLEEKLQRFIFDCNHKAGHSHSASWFEN